MSEMPDLARIIIVYCSKLDVIAVILQSKPTVSISDIGVEVVANVLGGCGGFEVDVTVWPESTVTIWKLMPDKNAFAVCS